MPDSVTKTIEIRAFGRLAERFTERDRPFPFILELKEPISGADLAQQLEIPRDEIEIIIVNGVVRALSYSIQPGDRVAFVPPGTPGPYRVLLGFVHKKME